MNPEAPDKKSETDSDKENSVTSRIESLTIKEDMTEGETEVEECLPVYPYERIKTDSTDPIAEIDVTKREVKL